MPANILVVEDEPAIQELIAANLLHAGHHVLRANDAEEAALLVRDTLPDVVLLDWMLPGMPGLQFARRLRADERTRDLPIIMLTARSEEHDKIAGLEAGADDYLTKPFPMEELIARVRALLRRPALVQELAPQLGDISISPQQACMHCAGSAIALPPAELQIMLSLVRKAGATVRRSTLEAAAWGMSSVVTPNALDVALHRLRRKLAAAGSCMEIVNIRGQGYALREPLLAR